MSNLKANDHRVPPLDPGSSNLLLEFPQDFFTSCFQNNFAHKFHISPVHATPHSPRFQHRNNVD
jgi:hypothetical protein